MPEKFIEYYDAMSSPWTYLGHKRFRVHGASVRSDHSPQTNGPAEGVVGFRGIATKAAC